MKRSPPSTKVKEFRVSYREKKFGIRNPRRTKCRRKPKFSMTEIAGSSSQSTVETLGVEFVMYTYKYSKCRVGGMEVKIRA